MFPKVNPLWATVLSLSASLPSLVLYAIALLALDIRREGKVRPLTVKLALAIIINSLSTWLLKEFTRVPRPGDRNAWGLLEASRYSFPSGHTSRAFTLAYFLSKKGGLIKLLWAYATLVGIARLALSVHWFSDVIVGAVLGVWACVLTENTYRYWLPIYNNIIGRVRLLKLE